MGQKDSYKWAEASCVLHGGVFGGYGVGFGVYGREKVVERQNQKSSGRRQHNGREEESLLPSQR